MVVTLVPYALVGLGTTGNKQALVSSAMEGLGTICYGKPWYLILGRPWHLMLWQALEPNAMVGLGTIGKGRT